MKLIKRKKKEACNMSFGSAQNSCQPIFRIGNYCILNETLISYPEKTS